MNSVKAWQPFPQSFAKPLSSVGSAWFCALALVLSLSTGCAPKPKTVANITVGNTGCPAEHLAVFNYVPDTRTWAAACDEKVYLCSTGGGVRCTAQKPETMDPEVAIRAAQLLELTKERRDRFITTDLTAASWEDFSREITLLKRLTPAQLEKLDPDTRLYAGFDADFNAQLRKCSNEDGTLDIVSRSKTGEASAVTINGRIRKCAPPMLAELQLPESLWGQQLRLFVDIYDLQPLPRPETVEAEAGSEPATEDEGALEVTAPESSLDQRAIRNWLDNLAAEVTACNGGKAAAVKIEIDQEGALRVSLHGPAAGSPEESCVQAVLPQQQFTGGPGSLIHVVKPPSVDQEKLESPVRTEE